MYSIMRQLNHFKFPSYLQLANITPVFKKGSKSQKKNYRPVSTLPIISEIFEKILSKQLSIFLKIYSQNFNKVLERVLLHNTVYY